MSGILVDINYVPRANNWPTGFSGYICGTIPSNDAFCATSDTPNIDVQQPRTFASCCNGPITNITSNITNPSDPNFGTVCLAYCPVDYARTVGNDSETFGDYFNCITNTTDQTFGLGDDPVTGKATCGWVNNTVQEICEASVSVAMSYYSIATASAAMSNATATTGFGPPASMSFDSCPNPSTAVPTPSSTGSSSKSNAESVRKDARCGSIVGSVLLMTFACLVFS